MAVDEIMVSIIPCPGIDRPPYVVSPVENYKAPNANASWIALGINGYIQQYNALIKDMHAWMDRAASAAILYEAPWATDDMRAESMGGLVYADTQGRHVINRYNALVMETHEQIVSACAQIKVSQPRQGTTVGVKCFTCYGFPLS